MPRKKKQKSTDIEVNLQIRMPRVMADKNDQESIANAEKVMEVVSQTCVSLISANKDVQLCMDMINFVGESKKSLNIAFNQNMSFDLDHFRIMMVALTASYEGVMNGMQIRIVPPLDFAKMEEMYGSFETNPS